MTLVVIRADASVAIGSGHVMRCLALADALRKAGAQIAFVCREFEGDLCSHLETNRFRVIRLPAGSSTAGDDADQTVEALGKGSASADWIVVDHYGLDERWEARMRYPGRKIMAIDDLPGRRHDCDLLLDQNLMPEGGGSYIGLVPQACRLLLGPRYALLRPEFARERTRLRQRDGELRRLLIFFGGSDPTDETSKALSGVLELGRNDLAIDVIVGSANPHKDLVRQRCATAANVAYHCQAENMAALMASADLALGAGGSASWERCCLQLPAVVAVLAENQVQVAATLARHGAVINLGDSSKTVSGDYAKAVSSLDRSALQEMSRAAATLADAGGAARVAAELVGNA